MAKMTGKWDHKKNSHDLSKTINQLKSKPTCTQPNRSIFVNNKPCTTTNEIAENFNKHFTNIVKHQTSKQNRITDKRIKNLPKETFIITPTQVQRAIQDSNPNFSTGPDNINIHHLKHLRPKATLY